MLNSVLRGEPIEPIDGENFSEKLFIRINLYGLDTYSVYVNGNTLGTLTGGWGSHWVKASSYMVWSGFDCEDDTVAENITVEYE